ncbi:hypothetical protein VaNZ11_009181 [Volvox africanus]|uniref:Peptidase S8/S53 domain-containing protein n=1 Tax=Volvox africanus TaxID=51714 RepID=A0ABQ5S7T1_9CHLO|nr:hypothetical protein VaNZ11_009181 [Volvox africanus]
MFRQTVAAGAIGRTSQVSTQLLWRLCITITFATIIFLSCIRAQDEDTGNTVVLGNGKVQLSGASDVAAAMAAAATTAANAAGASTGNGNSGGSGGGNGNGGGNGPASVPHGKDKLGRKLILLRYISDDSVWQLRNALLDSGAQVLDYVAYNTLLIQAKAESIGLAARYQALAAEYPPVLKLAAETSAVFKAAAAASAKMLYNPQQQQKTRRQLAAGGVAANNNKPSPAAAASANNSSPAAAASANNNNLPPAAAASANNSSPAAAASANYNNPPPAASAGGGTLLPPPAALSASNVSSNNPFPTGPARGFKSGLGNVATAGVGNDTDASNVSRSDGALNALSTWRMYLKASKPNVKNHTSPGGGPHRPPPPPSPSGSGAANNATSGGPELYAASVRLVPGLSEKAPSTIAEAWPPALAEAVGIKNRTDECWPQVVADGLYSQSSPILLVYLCAKNYEAALTWLSGLDTVVWVEPVLQAGIRNAVAGWIVQTGNISTTLFDNPTSALRPYWAANLQGQGIIVGVEDTGLDMSHCNFIDDRWRTGSLRTLFVGLPPRLYLPDHRKVVQYMLPISSGINAWFGDQPYGHGSHVAGSIAGAAYTNNKTLINQRSTGSAPKARLSFFDLASYSGLNLPMPIDDKILPYHYAAGARLSSSSWGYMGSLGVSYNEVCRQFDAFSWRNPDFLSIIAAGNDGDNGFIPTVTAPSTAKNVLSIGASINHPTGTASSGFNYAILFRYTDAAGKNQSYSMWPYLGSYDYYWRTLLYNKEVPLRISSPLNACTPLIGNYTGAVVMVDLAGTACTPDQRAINARSAGAVAVMFIAVGNGFLDGSQDVIPSISDPNTIYGLTTRAEGLNTIALLSNTTLGVTRPHMTFITYPNINLGVDGLPYFSSYGPFTDGRFKPDIVAPGTGLESTASGPGISQDVDGGSCSSKTVSMSGTSMATPIVAGHLALARQYFRDGYYPTGAPGDPASVGFEPSGILLKAAAIAGARSLEGGFAGNGGFFLGAAPDGYQGWGRLDLSRMLPLPNYTSPFFRVSVADFGVINQGDYIYLAGVEATGTGPIFAALVWHDYPASPASKKNLVNDLDFGYTINGGSYIRTRIDSTNNVERVELSSTNVLAGDRITYVVYGRNIRSKLLTGSDAQLPQRWAVVVVGHFNGTLRTQYNPAYIRPQQYLTDTQVTFGLPGGGCMYVKTDAILSNGNCTTLTANFTLVEEPALPGDPSIGPKLLSNYGYLYSIRDTAGRCITVPGNVSGTRVGLAPCNASDPSQKIGLFRNTQVNGPFYSLVPSFALWSSAGAVARCLKQTSASFIVLIACNDDDLDQRFEIRSSAATRPPRPPPPPSPAPPLPSPQAPAQQWYPYSLVFRADWYPVGKTNLNDYDYLENHNGYGDQYYTDIGTDDLDIIVSWTWGGVSYSMGRRTENAENVTLMTGIEYGGDNMDYGTQYEIVFFQATTKPPPTAFHVCVAWQSTKTPLFRVVMSVFRGYAVATADKVLDTSRVADLICNSSASGYLGTYDVTRPAPPPAPPSPPVPQPYNSSYPLLFRADWAIVSGMRGRPTKTYDLDILVSWGVGNSSYVISSFAQQAGGGNYGGDNMRNGGNYEIVYWPPGVPLPPTNTFHVCVRWNEMPKPLLKVTLSVFKDNLVTTSTKMIDTTLEWSDTCEPSAIGYIDSFWIGTTRGLLDDLSYSNCHSTPEPSPVFGLYILAQWTAPNVTGAGSVDAIFDWDLVVTWRWQGEIYELSPYSRFVGGAVHGGDNMRLIEPTNKEAVYWPTGLTGIEPSPTQYDVCVRWYAAGRLNVTLSVFLYNNLVLNQATVWDGSTVNSKACSPLAVGYLGSYSYNGIIPFQGRRSAQELFGAQELTAGGTGDGALTMDDLRNLVP